MQTADLVAAAHNFQTHLMQQPIRVDQLAESQPRRTAVCAIWESDIVYDSCDMFVQEELQVLGLITSPMIGY